MIEELRKLVRAYSLELRINGEGQASRVVEQLTEAIGILTAQIHLLKEENERLKARIADLQTEGPTCRLTGSPSCKQRPCPCNGGV